MTIEDIRELIALAQETGIAELEVERGGNRVRIRRQMTAQEVVLAGPGVVAAPQMVAQAAAAPPPPAGGTQTAVTADPSLVLLKSPIVGTFYEAPNPDSPPFVKVGDAVTVGQVMCIIESMKLMNEIEAEVSGTVVAKLVENGRPVEYGEAMFSIRPA